MKKFIIAVLILWTGIALAQNDTAVSPLNATISPSNANIIEPLIPISRSDIYCAGFVTKEPVPKTSFVAGGLNSPYSTHFDDRDFIFVKGTSVKPGSLVSIIRAVRNPDDWEIYPGTKKLLDATGQPFFDIGYARVTELRAEVAVAQVEFACEPILPGDVAVPFVQRPTISIRKFSTMDRFPAEKPTLSGKIVLGQNFDQLIKVGGKVYISIGSEKGVKCGDYFRVTRGYSPNATDRSDAAEFDNAPIDDTQKNPQYIPRGQRGTVLPRRVVGEIIILNVTPTSATGMVTFGLEEMHVGDGVELEPAQAEPVQGAGNN